LWQLRGVVIVDLLLLFYGRRDRPANRVARPRPFDRTNSSCNSRPNLVFLFPDSLAWDSLPAGRAEKMARISAPFSARSICLLPAHGLGLRSPSYIHPWWPDSPTRPVGMDRRSLNGADDGWSERQGGITEDPKPVVRSP